MTELGRRRIHYLSLGRAYWGCAVLLEAALVLLQEVASQLSAQVFVTGVHIHIQAVQLHEHPSILLLEHTFAPQTLFRLWIVEGSLSYKFSEGMEIRYNFSD